MLCYCSSTVTKYHFLVILYSLRVSMYLKTFIHVAPCKGHTIFDRSLVCNRSWHPLGNPQLVWHPADLIDQGACVNLPMDTMDLKDPLVLFKSEGSALTLPLFLLSARIIMLCHCSSTTVR